MLFYKHCNLQVVSKKDTPTPKGREFVSKEIKPVMFVYICMDNLSQSRPDKCIPFN